MAKASLAGRSKTRLVPPLTCEEAAHCNTAFLRDVGDNILAASAHASIAGYVAFGPPQARPFFQQNLPREIGLIDAWYPNFGDCLACAIARALAERNGGTLTLVSGGKGTTFALKLPAFLSVVAPETPRWMGRRALAP